MQCVRGRSSGAGELRSPVAHALHSHVTYKAMQVVVHGRTAIRALAENLEVRRRTRPGAPLVRYIVRILRQ